MDGWSGDEISDWPTRAWSIFLQLWKDGQIGESFRRFGVSCGRYFLEEADTDATRPEKLRPIAIESIFCRALASAMVKKSVVKEWVLSLVGVDSHGGIARQRRGDCNC